MRGKIARWIKSAATVPALLLAGLGAGAGEAEVWCPNTCVSVYEGEDYTGRNDPNAVVRIFGARNGSFTGQAVVFSKTPTKGPEAKLGELKLKDGDGSAALTAGASIPASAVSILYALPTGPGLHHTNRFDALGAAPRENGQTHPVWLKIKVPADAKAGLYRGELTLAERKVPVELTVADWKMPDPRDYVTHAGFVQSPESVALQYKADLWSDKHFELMGKSLDLLGEVGNKVMFIHLIGWSHFGNQQTMVRWIKKGDGYDYDYTPAEKYIDLYLKKVGKPDVVCLYVWEKTCRRISGRRKAEGYQSPVTLLDPATGKTEDLLSPWQDTPESETFWKPVMEGMRKRLNDRGIADEHLMIGLTNDASAPPEQVQVWKRIAPWALWVKQCHAKSTREGGADGQAVGYLSYVYVNPASKPEEIPLGHGWAGPPRLTWFPRENMNDGRPPADYRMFAERCYSRNLRGFGRIGADFWPVIKDEKGRGACLVHRYPEASAFQLSLTTATPAILSPGPDGAQSTARFEMTREGVQECEARAFVEKALMDKDARAKLGEEKAAKMEEMLRERWRALYRVGNVKKNPEAKDEEWFAGESGWPERARQLFEAAAAVAAATGQK